MEARLFQTNENNIFDFDFNPEGCLFPTDEQNKFISSKAEEIENYINVNINLYFL